MICAVIPTLNSGEALAPLIDALGRGCARIIVTDGGSTNATLRTAVAGGALIAIGSKGRGTQLRRGVKWAGECEWLLCLHSDIRLPENWREAVDRHIEKRPHKVGYFKFGADTDRFYGRIMEFLVGLRSYWWRLPYGDQGLLISRTLYEEIGGYPDVPLFEDIGILDRIYDAVGREGFHVLGAKVQTDVSAYARDGWRKRTGRNFALLKAYRRGVPIETLQKEYQ